MAPNARFTSAPGAELREAVAFYEAAENGLGASFLDEVEAAVAPILANPEAWAPISPRTRRCRTHRFPFGLLCHYPMKSSYGLWPLTRWAFRLPPGRT